MSALALQSLDPAADVRTVVYAGTDFALRVNVKKLSDQSNVDLTSATIAYEAYAKRKQRDSYQPGQGAVVIRRTTAPGDGITFMDADDGLIEITLEPSHTANLKGDYSHQLYIVDALGADTKGNLGILAVIALQVAAPT